MIFFNIPRPVFLRVAISLDLFSLKPAAPELRDRSRSC